MIWQVLPWKFLLRRAAKAHGFLDPISLLARVRSFAQPSEVKEPMELVRANMLFQARGMINARAIQFNLDWVWPHWVEKQFNPRDPSFIPRGYVLTHVNLTHRNWTAVGLPDAPLYPLVDPRGLVTPLYDGWSIDTAVFSADGPPLFPSKLDAVEQTLEMEDDLAVRTDARRGALSLTSRVKIVLQNDTPVLAIEVKARCGTGGRLAVSLRPYNPEGIQFVEHIAVQSNGAGWRIGQEEIRFSRRPDRVALSNYRSGDVLKRSKADADEIACPIGMATAAAYFGPQEDGHAAVTIEVPLQSDLDRHFPRFELATRRWEEVLAETPQLKIAAGRMRFLFEAAKRTLVLLSADEMVPGPFTYRRFWFRDAVLMGHALLGLNLADRLGRHIRRFPERQKPDGYFESQEGEWDANGQVLWLVECWSRVSGLAVDGDLLAAVMKGAEWIITKRMRRPDDPLLDGLLPAGFSAEHLGPNDYYYWDDFWGIAGLRAAASLARKGGLEARARTFSREARDLEAAVFRSIGAIPAAGRRGGIPASPLRRMDAGAVGSMVADYPLGITPPGDAAILDTLAFLLKHCFLGEGFFQDMVHSGINAYLTLALAQTMLRAGDERYAALVETVADLASPTGNWPEAVHPFSGGGCMGDGQHGWAAAEWVNLVRHLFVREEDDGLILGSGVLPRWIADEAFFGPTATPYGRVSLRLTRNREGMAADVEAMWYGKAPPMRIAVPGHYPAEGVQTGETVVLKPL